MSVQPTQTTPLADAPDLHDAPDASGMPWQRRSLWLEAALAVEGDDPATPPLRGDVEADVCIVGGGYTGLWTAIALLEAEPSTRVVLLEADICGGAASGRNGGFCLSWWPKIQTLVDRVGAREAVELARASAQAIDDLGDFCAREGIDAHFRKAGWIWTATSPAQEGAWAGAVKTCEQLGERPFELLDRDEVRRRLGSAAHRGGVFEAQAATVQPALLARGLRTAAVRRGLTLHERSPMVALDRARGRVATPAGSVRADTIVLATNAWLSQVPGLRRAVVPISSDVVATEPIPELLEEIGWTGGEAVSNSRLMVDYYRTTRDGRIVFGRGGGGLAWRGRFGRRFDYDDARARDTRAALERLVPAAADVRITHAWGGAVDRSSDGLPFFGQLHGRARVLYGVGLSGNGVAPSVIAGRILAAAALGQRDGWGDCGLVAGVPGRFPPEPLRYVGGRIVRAAVQRKETREDDNRPVSWVTRRIAALAPSGFFKVSDGA